MLHLARNLKAIWIVPLLLLPAVGCQLGTDPSKIWHFRGAVVNRTTSAPVPGVQVQAYYSGGCGFFGCSPEKILKSTVTDSKGAFSMDVDEGDGVCLGVELRAVAAGTSTRIFGTVNDCEGLGEILNVVLYVNGS